MHERHANRVAYLTLIDIDVHPTDPGVYLEIGMERPVDWDAVDADGSVICRKLGFRLIVDGVGIGDIGVLCGYDRTIRDFGLHDGSYVYVLLLRPLPDELGRDGDATALHAVAQEARLKGKPWCAEVRGVAMFWRHAPDEVAALENGSYAPDPAPAAAPRASEEDILRMCTALDDFFEEAASGEDQVIPLKDEDLEYEVPELDLDSAEVRLETASAA